MTTIIGTHQDWAKFKQWIDDYSPSLQGSEASSEHSPSQNYTDIAKYICLGAEMRMSYSILIDYLAKYCHPESYEIIHTKDMRCGDKHLCLILDHDLVSYEGLVIRFYRGNQLVFTPHIDLPHYILHNLLIPPITLAGIVQHYSRNILIPSEFMLHFYRLSSVLYPHAFNIASLNLNPLPTLK